MPRFPSGPRRGGPSTYIRKNDRIRARQVRLIGPDGRQLGVVDRDEALSLAKQVGLDLVEVAATANPPVCRILDFGKYMYELSKKEKDKKHNTSKIKEVKFRVRIEQHDYETKLRRAEEFLFKGNKVKVTLQFRGREMEHRELGVDVVNRAVEDLAHVATADSPPRMAGRMVNLIMSPLPQNKRKLKFNEPDIVHKPDTPDDHDEEDDDDDEGDEQE